MNESLINYAMSLNFKNAVPTAMTIRKPSSTSKGIKRKELMEIPPTEQSTYSPSGNTLMRFVLSSNNAFVSGAESYLRFKLQRDTADTYGTTPSLDVGGAHSLFKSIEVRHLGTGALIQRADEYATMAALMMSIHQTPEDVEYAGHSYGDSISGKPYGNPWKSNTFNLSSTIASVTTTGTALVLGAAGHALTEVEAGDLIHLSSIVVGASGVFEVASVTSDTAIVLKTAVGANTTATDAKYIFVEKRNKQVSSRNRAVEVISTDYTVCMKSMMSVLQQTLPLFLIPNGIEIQFELQNANLSLSTNLPVADSATAHSYLISTPRYMAMMVEPNSDIIDEYVSQWNTDAGLIYNIPSMRYRRQTGVAGDEDVNYQVNVGVRSARRVYTVIQDTLISETIGNTVRGNESLSTFVRSNVTSFQYKIGSSEFPNRAVICDAYSPEAFEHLKQVAQTRGVRFPLSDWQDVNALPLSASAATAQATKFIMAADLSRDNGLGSNLTGSDLSRVPLDLELKRTGTHAASSLTGAPVIKMFVEYDAYLKLNKSQVVVMS